MIRRLYSLLALCCCANLLAEPEQKPNIVFIMADDLGLGDVSYYVRDLKGREPLVETPMLDELARQSLWFTDGHSATSLCAPTRYAVMSGRNNYRCYMPAGVWSPFWRTPYKPNDVTLGRVVRDAGYRTGFVGKWHTGGDFKLVESDEIHRAMGGGDLTGKVDLTTWISGGPEYCGFDYDFTSPCGIQGPLYLCYENGAWYPLAEDSEIVHLTEENAIDPNDLSSKGPGMGDSQWLAKDFGSYSPRKRSTSSSNLQTTLSFSTTAHPWSTNPIARPTSLMARR